MLKPRFLDRTFALLAAVTFVAPDPVLALRPHADSARLEESLSPRHSAAGVEEVPSVQSSEDIQAVLKPRWPFLSRGQGALVFDVDKTLLPNRVRLDGSRVGGAATSPEEAVLAQTVGEHLAALLKQGVRVVVISGNSRAIQMERIVSPLRSKLESDVAALQSLTLYANGGTTRSTFDRLGNEILDVGYNDRFLLPPGLIGAIRQSLAEMLVNTRLGLTEDEQKIWKDWYAGRKDFHGTTFTAPWLEGQPVSVSVVEQGQVSGVMSAPYLEVRDGVQLSIGLLPKDPRDVRAFVIEKLSQAAEAVGVPLSFRKGGFASIDISRADIDKGIALAYEVGHSKLNPNAVLYFGDEFFVEMAGGVRLEGNDVPVLRVADILPVAVGDQAPELSLDESQRLVYGGRGPAAISTWMENLLKLPSAAGTEALGRPGIPSHKRAVLIGGTGNIGRGYIAPLLAADDFDLLFVDFNQEMITSANQRDSYVVTPVGPGKPVTVNHFWGIDARQEERVAAQGPRADWIFTTVGTNNLIKLKSVIYQFIRKRIEAGHLETLNIVFAENLPVDQPQIAALRKAVLEMADDDATRQYVEQKVNFVGSGQFYDYTDGYVGWVGAVVSITVPPTIAAASDNPLNINVEGGGPYYLEVDAKELRGSKFIPSGMRPVENIRAAREKKLLIHNMGHAALAYFSAAFGITDPAEGIRDPRVAKLVRRAMMESAAGLHRRYPELFPMPGLVDYIGQLMDRFSNRELADTVERIARDPLRKLEENDRLFGAAISASQAGTAPEAITLAIAAAIRYAKEVDHLSEDKLAPVLALVRKHNLQLPENEAAFLARVEQVAAAGAEQTDAGGEPLPALQARLKKPQVTSASGVRARVLTGPGKTYDAIVMDQFPTGMVPALQGGLSVLLDQLNSGGPFTWIDGAGGLGAALREGRNLYSNIQPVLIDAVQWTPDQFTDEVRKELESQAADRGIDLWAPKGVSFIQGDLSRVDLGSLGGPPAQLFTMLNALAYNKDPLGLLVNIYNQLPEGALMLTNLYIPTGHPRAEDLSRFYERLFQRLEKDGIADLQVTDLRTMNGTDLNNQLEIGPFDEFALGIVLKKGPGRLRLNVQPRSEPFLVIPRPGSGGREVEYEVAWYGQDPSQVLTYGITAAGAEEQFTALISDVRKGTQRVDEFDLSIDALEAGKLMERLGFQTGRPLTALRQNNNFFAVTDGESVLILDSAMAGTRTAWSEYAQQKVLTPRPREFSAKQLGLEVRLQPSGDLLNLGDQLQIMLHPVPAAGVDQDLRDAGQALRRIFPDVLLDKAKLSAQGYVLKNDAALAALFLLKHYDPLWGSLSVAVVTPQQRDRLRAIAAAAGFSDLQVQFWEEDYLILYDPAVEGDEQDKTGTASAAIVTRLQRLGFSSTAADVRLVPNLPDALEAFGQELQALLASFGFIFPDGTLDQGVIAALHRAAQA